ncbi:MAG: hypothetical protein L0H93_04195, partial [Nocardioides sp.]|nr:hypothetical protein [Nocardioides sp.]
VAWGQAMEADAARRAVAGDPTLAGAEKVAPDADLVALSSAVQQGYDALASALPDGAELDPGTPVKIPAGTMPLTGALTLCAVEAGLHASDLANALGDRGELAPAETAACVALIRPLLGLSAGMGAAPGPGSSIELAGESVSEQWTAHGSAWAPGRGEAATKVSGSDEAIALFVYGRIGHTSELLEVTGDPDVAARFKDFFPGP